jgi:hypothetical protein
LFHHQGGVDLGGRGTKKQKIDVPVGVSIDAGTIEAKLLTNVVAAKKL